MQKKVLPLILGALALLVGILLVLVVTHLLLTQRQRAVLADYRRHMSDPAYLAAQTNKLQPLITEQISASFPHVEITPAAQPGKDGQAIYEVHLPPGETRDLPRLQAQIARLYGEYRRKGFHGTFLIYQDGKVVRSVP